MKFLSILLLTLSFNIFAQEEMIFAGVAEHETNLIAVTSFKNLGTILTKDAIYKASIVTTDNGSDLNPEIAYLTLNASSLDRIVFYIGEGTKVLSAKLNKSLTIDLKLQYLDPETIKKKTMCFKVELFKNKLVENELQLLARDAVKTVVACK
jgi:hypothetical protein